MAFTDAEKADIREYCGYSERWHQADSVLERAIAAVEGDVTAEANVRADITACQDIETRVVEAYGRLKAMKVGSINLPGTAEVRELERQGAKYASRLCARLGVPKRHDVFSARAPQGTQTYAGMVGGGNYGSHG